MDVIRTGGTVPVMKPINEETSNGDGDGEKNLGNGKVSVTRIAPKRKFFQVRRPAYTQAAFDEGYSFHKKHTKSPKECFRQRCKCTLSCVSKVLLKLFPFVKIMREYDIREDLLGDVIAGITVGIMHIPQGMAYGMLTTLAPVYGLYSSFFPVFVYFFFGTSRHISIGTFAVVSMMVGGVVEKAGCVTNNNGSLSSGGHSNETVYGLGNSTLDGALVNGTAIDDQPNVDVVCQLAVATSVTMIAGFYQLLLGTCRFGFMTVYLSEALMRGFTTGVTIHVFTSQIKYIFGIRVAKFSGIGKIYFIYEDFCRKIVLVNWGALVTSVICIALLILTKEVINPRVKKKLRMPIPIELLLIIFGTVASYFGKFKERFAMRVVGEIPTGLPFPSAPPLLEYFPSVAVDAIGIAIVSFAVSISMGKLFAKKHSYRIDSNQELIAYGICNIFSSFFSSYASVASLSRSLIQESVGGHTQIAGLVSCCLLLVVLCAVGSLFQQLPNCILAAIIIVNLKGMFEQFFDLKKLWFISKYDFATWLVIFCAVVVFDVDLGLIIGVAFSLLTVVIRTQRPYTCIMGRVLHTDIYKDISVYNAAMEIPRIKIFRFESSLYYANGEYFVKKLYSKSGVNPLLVKAARVKAQKRLAREEKKNKKSCLRKRKMGRAEGKNTADVEDQPVENQCVVIESAEPLNSQALDIVPKPDLDYIVIDCSTIGFIDWFGVTILSQVIADYSDISITVMLAGCKAGIRQMLESAGFFEKINKANLCLAVHDAVLLSLQRQQLLLHEVRKDSLFLRSESVFAGSSEDDEAELRDDGQVPVIQDTVQEGDVLSSRKSTTRS